MYNQCLIVIIIIFVIQSYYLILKLIFHAFINNIVFSSTQMIDKIIYDIGIFKTMFIFCMGHVIFSGGKTRFLAWKLY